MKDFHCYLQPQEVPYCSMTVYSDRADAAVDIFKFNQVCEDELGRFDVSLLRRCLAIVTGARPTQAGAASGVFAHEGQSKTGRIRDENHI